ARGPAAERGAAGPPSGAARVVGREAGEIVLDASREDAMSWLAEHRPAFLGLEPVTDEATPGEELCTLARVAFAYPGGPPVADGFSLSLRRGEVVALTGP